LPFVPPTVRIPVVRPGSYVYLVVEPDGGASAEAFHFNVDPPPFLSAPLPHQNGAKLYLLYYTCSLECLGIGSGALELSMSEGRAFTAAASLEAATYTAGHDADWQPLSELPPEVGAIHVQGPGPNPCVQFDAQKVAFEPNAHGTLLVGLDDSTVLTATDQGHFFRVSALGAERLTGLSTSTPHRAAFRDVRGEIYLIGDHSEIARGDLDRGFESISGVTEMYSDHMTWVDGPRDASPFELFLATLGGAFKYFDGTSWTTIEPEAGLAGGGVVWIAEHEALAPMSRMSGRVTRYVSGAKSYETVDPELILLTASAYVEGFGPVFGGDDGAIFIQSEGSWHGVGILALKSITVITGIGTGLLFGGGPALLQQYYPGFGLCPSAVHSGTGDVLVVRVGAGYAFLSKTDEAGQGPGDIIDFLTPTPRSDCACASP
jgi:hypothetical protein